MKVTTERTEKCQAIVTVEVDEAQIADAMKRVAQKVSRARPIPGFRPGKAPYERIERAVGKEFLREEAVEEVAQPIYKQVLNDEKIEPYDAGSLDIVQKDPLIIKFTIPTRPIVTLGDYRSIHLQPKPVQVSDEEIDRVIDQIRNGQATLTPVTRPVQLKDLVTVDLKGGLEEQTPIDRQGMQLRVDPVNKVFPWIEQLVGATLNEARTVTYTYPAEDPVNAGKTATYAITVTDIKEPQLPNLDDEFAKSVGAFESLDQLRGRIRTNLNEEKLAEENNRFADEVIGAVVEQAQIAFPDSMVEDESAIEMARSKDMAQRLGLAWDKYLQLSGKTEDEFRESIRPAAEGRIKRLLTLMQLADNEQIQITSKDVDVEIDQRAQQATANGGRADQARRALSKSDSRRDIEFSLKLNRAMEWIVATVKGDPTSGKILTPDMIQGGASTQEPASQAAPAAAQGLITDPSQVSSENWPRGLDRPLVPGQNP